MTLCKGITKKGDSCSNHAQSGSDYCWFHGDKVSAPRSIVRDMYDSGAKKIKAKGYSYERLFGKNIGDMPRIGRIRQMRDFYNDGGIIAKAMDSYEYVATANGYQLIDSKTGETETDTTEIVQELDYRINFHEMFTKIDLNNILYGFCWGEIVDDGKQITELLFLRPEELKLTRNNNIITKMEQIKAGKVVATWSGKKLKKAFFIKQPVETSEPFPVGMLQKIYTEAKSWKDQGKDLDAVTKFVSYPFRVVKVGSDVYPASSAAVTKVGDQVELLEPGDWLATRHNLEFEFHAPEVPEALITQYIEKTKQLVVSLGVPSLYTALDEIDANTLKELRSIFNANVQSLQITVTRQFEDQIIKREFDLKGKLKKRTDAPPVTIEWNPLAAGVMGLDEARRILESMGYGLLRGDKWRSDLSPQAEIQNPKSTHPTDDNPDKTPTKPPQKSTDKPPKKSAPVAPTVKKPQPNSPKASITYDQWLEGINVLTVKHPFYV